MGQEGTPQFLYGNQLRLIFPGLEQYVELPVGRSLVVRSEIALNLGYVKRTFGQKVSGFGLVLAGTVSPRWYYNYNKRFVRGKSVYRNSANFLTVRSTFLPGFLIGKSNGALRPMTGFTVIPSWGLRRPLGKLILEASAGLGFRRTAPKGESKTSGGGFDLRVQIGF
ncbi:hypothetical protein CLV84_2954 [Neolewinella xylanilytica]|uniref:Surface antigen-like protein n=1 Tax=Neolewinella xylanilytica TaxID=1514080 RepID=A0A2S6I4C8_9BACT|nr:hypothetical protein CLV84_2954 [Neolewinella xylanilytica]